MEKEQLGNWQKTVDQAEFAPMATGLPPEAPLGTQEREADRLWIRVLVKYGKGQWAYWLDKSAHTVVADVIFNGDAHHFAGFLAKPHQIPVESAEWVLVEPRIRPKSVRNLYIEDAEKREGRYETNDVDRITPNKVKEIPG